MLVGDVPQLFRPGQYTGSISVAAMVLYYVLLSSVGMESNAAAWVALMVAAALRLLVIRFNWQSQAVNEWRVDRALGRLPQEFTELYRKRVAERHKSDDEP